MDEDDYILTKFQANRVCRAAMDTLDLLTYFCLPFEVAVLNNNKKKKLLA